MKALLQRVIKASVKIDDIVVGEIGHGLIVMVGITQSDTEQDINYLVNKIVNLRIFSDAANKFNLSLIEIRAELLIISQFTLLADTRRGRRPNFIEAASPEHAKALFNLFVDRMRSTGLKVNTGRFQEHMIVEIHNDGPVTIALDSKEKIA